MVLPAQTTRDATVTTEQVRAACRARKWVLADAWEPGSGGPSLRAKVLKPLDAESRDREEIGRGDTPHDAFLDACEREGVTPF